MYRRAAYSLILIASVLLIGTLAFHYIEWYSYVDPFYFVSMLATAQGPSFTPATALGKIVASIIAFVSVGGVVVSLIFLFGPFFGYLFSIGARKFDEDERKLIKYTENDI